jgi:ankyrin repeat protein
VGRDAERSAPVSEVDDELPVSTHPGSTAATFCREDIISKRLAGLSEERHISPIIFKAAALHDHMTCARLIQEGVDCDIPGPSGRSLAHVAAMTGNERLLRILTSSSKRIWSTCSQAKVPLDYAALNNHLELVKHLVVEDASFFFFTSYRKIAILERSTDFAHSRGHTGVAGYLEERSQDIQRTQNEQLFRDAVCKNDIKRVKELLKEGISESSAIWTACLWGFIPMVSVLLSSTVDGFSYDLPMAINHAATDGQQDLLVLLLCGIDDASERKLAAKEAYRCCLKDDQLKMCEFLVLCGEVDGHDAFEVASDHQHRYLLQWIIELKGKSTFRGWAINRAFHAAISSCSDLPLVRFLVESGADYNSEHKIWGTTLQCAAVNSNFDVVRYLVTEGGADINAPGGLGRLGGSSPVMAAVSAGNSSIFHYFVSLQACLDKQHGFFGNILQTACYLGRLEILKEILSSGFDINARLEPYGSAFIMAIQAGNFDIAELLISRGADVTLNIPKHGTALHLAAARGIENTVKLLIQAGANINAEGGDFGTPLQAAAAHDHQLIVMNLLDCGAEINTQGGMYKNALLAAQVQGHSLLAKLLLFSGAKLTE